MSGAAWHAFLAMGGYAAYVWPAYAVFFAVLVADTLAPALRRRHVVRELRAQLVRQAARHAGRATDTVASKTPGASAVPPRSA